MTTARVLFWHRRDLRMADNLGLVAAADISPAVTGVYVLDPQVINPPDHLPPMAPARLWFLIESLVELQQRWREAGSRLLIVDGDPVAVLPQLAEQIGADAVVWNRDVEPYARERDRQVAKKLQADGRKVVVDWDQLLIAPELLKTGGGAPYRVYGPFLRNWRGQVLAKQPSSVAAPTALVDLDLSQVPAGDPLEVLRGSHGFKGAEICPCRPGEAAALAQLTAFCDGPLLGYEPDRNFPSTPGTSYLSAALSVGTLSPRQAWCAAQDSREQARSEEHLQAIAVWEQELGWREFYQQALFHFPELADGPTASSGAASPGRTTRTGSTSGRRADRHADHRCRHAPAQPDRLDAQPLPHDRGLLSGQRSDLRLALGRARLHGTGGGR
jgi:deoxyribodipyrimidine photo-lyase